MWSPNNHRLVHGSRQQTQWLMTTIVCMHNNEVLINNKKNKLLLLGALCKIRCFWNNHNFGTAPFKLALLCLYHNHWNHSAAFEVINRFQSIILLKKDLKPSYVLLVWAHVRELWCVLQGCPICDQNPACHAFLSSSQSLTDFGKIRWPAAIAT